MVGNFVPDGRRFAPGLGDWLLMLGICLGWGGGLCGGCDSFIYLG